MKTSTVPKPSVSSHRQPARENPRTPAKRRVRFLVEAPSGSHVSVVGSFNQWTPDKHSLRECPQLSGHFERVMVLPPGRYEYKFVINGEWTADLRCPRWVVNEFQTLNSVMILRQNDASEPSPE